MTFHLNAVVQILLPYLASLVGIVALFTGASLVVFLNRSPALSTARLSLNKIKSETDRTFVEIEKEIAFVENATKPNTPSESQSIVEHYRNIQNLNRHLKNLFIKAEEIRKGIEISDESDFLAQITNKSDSIDRRVSHLIDMFSKDTLIS